MSLAVFCRFECDTGGGGDFVGDDSEFEMTQEELDDLVKKLPMILEELEKDNSIEVFKIPFKTD